MVRLEDRRWHCDVKNRRFTPRFEKSSELNRFLVFNLFCTDTLAIATHLWPNQTMSAIDEFKLLKDQGYLVIPNVLTEVECKTAITNTAQLVELNLKSNPLSPQVPIEYEFIHRMVRRKVQLLPSEKIQLEQDFVFIEKH